MTAEPLRDFVAGLCGGCAGLVFGHPFDTVKVRQQCYTKKSRNMLQAVRTTFIHDGLNGFYKGMAFPLLSVSVLNSVFFGVYGNTLRYINEQKHGDKNAKASYSDVFLVAAFAGGVQALPATTIELIKVKLQAQTNAVNRGSHLTKRYRGPITSIVFMIYTDHGMHGVINGAGRRLGPKAFGTPQPISHTMSAQKTYKGPIQCFRSIYRDHGMKGISTGLPSTIARELPGFAVYMVTYAYLLDMLNQPSEKPTVASLLLAGGFAGVLSWVGNIPFDVVKSRLQADNLENPRYSGYWDCVRKSYRDEGWRVFWRGLPVTCLRAFPTNAITLCVYSTTMDALAAANL